MFLQTYNAFPYYHFTHFYFIPFWTRLIKATFYSIMTTVRHGLFSRHISGFECGPIRVSNISDYIYFFVIFFTFQFNFFYYPSRTVIAI